MDNQAKEGRRAEIEAAAYRLLAERGYGGMSMLTVAKTAGASNETLYRWYGDKAGLVAVMIAANTALVLDHLTEVAQAPQPLEQELRAVGDALLRLMVGERSVALMRAAAADASGQLGQTLSEGVRGQVMPRLAAMIARHRLDGEAGAACFAALLLGDWPMGRVIAGTPMPDEAAIVARVAEAGERFLALVRRGFFKISKLTARQAVVNAQISFDFARGPL